MSTRVEDLAGLPPGQAPRNVVLRHYKLVQDARSKGWKWREIAEALGLTEPSAKRAYWRVRRQIQAGRIDPEKLKEPPPASKAGRATAPRAAQPPRQQRSQSEQTNTTALAEMGVEIIRGDQQ